MAPDSLLTLGLHSPFMRFGTSASRLAASKRSNSRLFKPQPPEGGGTQGPPGAITGWPAAGRESAGELATGP